MRVVMHSFTFRTYPLEYAFRSAVRFGWEGLELQPCHFDASKLETELPRCQALADRYGVPIVCVDFSADLINSDDGVRRREVERLERDIAVCAEHGVTLMNGTAGILAQSDTDFGRNGSAMATDDHFARAGEALAHLGATAAKHGVTLALEIHMNTLHDTIDAANRLLDRAASDHVVANPDPGNMFATSTAEKDANALDALKGRIGYFHLKNCRFVAGCYDFGARLEEGHIDLNKWVQKLVDLGYGGMVCVEFCGDGDPHVAAEKDIAYVRRCLGWADRPA